jgi:DNA helicase-2/ATP-dependent DNA helicase PcrA
MPAGGSRVGEGEQERSRGPRYITIKRSAPAVEGGEGLRIDYERALNPEQYAAVTTIEGPVLIVAGAGSGKTRVITYRVAYLVESGAPPERIVLLTFTRRAAGEMLDRAQALTGRDCRRVQGGTFHSFAHLLLRRHARHVGLEPNFVIMDQADSEDAVKLVRDELGLGEGERRFPNKRTVFSVISKARNKQASVADIVLEEYPQFESEIEGLEAIAKGYARLKQERNLLDFDDLLERLRDLLASDFGRALAGQYLHVMADEYQDTNRVQAEIVRLLARVHGNVCVVGDDAQCIYSWRGSDFENILRFEEQFPGTRVIKLERNYRSTQPILDVANRVMARAQRAYTKVLRAEQPGDELPWFVELDDPRTQADFIATRVLELREEGVPLREIAVLVRAVWHLRELELELGRRNIPYVVYGGVRFTEAAHIKDLLAYLRVAVTPRDDISWKRILELLRGVGAKTSKRMIAALLAAENPWELLGSRKLRPPKAAAEPLRRMARLLGAIAAEDPAPAEALEAIRDFYAPILRERFDDYPRRESELAQLLSMAAGYHSSQSLLADIALEPNRDRYRDRRGNPDPERDFLVLSTIHSAKGLEFHAVFVPHLVEGIFPAIRTHSTPEEIEEERRLLYVAITRAKRELCLSLPRRLPGRGWMERTSGMDNRSRFLDREVLDLVQQVVADYDYY